MLSSVSTASQPPGFSPSGLLASEPLTSEQMKAFQVNSEPKDIAEKYGNNNFGRGCLMARRLVEDGLAGQVRRCPGAGCGWLFLDEGRGRRWCVMAIATSR